LEIGQYGQQGILATTKREVCKFQGYSLGIRNYNFPCEVVHDEEPIRRRDGRTGW
jgi:hypothetical protein